MLSGDGLDVRDLSVLDLFSAAAGGWSLGLHRAGFATVAACECVPWRRALYAENNPGVPIYDDVRGLTAERLERDLGRLPDIVVGSPPCQDISSANTSGKGVDGERSGLFFEAVRLIGECRPRWFALENSANLRTRGADAVLAALEGHGYACWPFVVRAADVGANHVRARSWLIGCDADRLARDPLAAICRWSDPVDARGVAGDTAQDRRGSRRPRRCVEPAPGLSEPTCGHDADAAQDGRGPWAGNVQSARRENDRNGASLVSSSGSAAAGVVAHADGEGQSPLAEHGEMGGSAGAGGDAAGPWADWNGGLARHLQLDDGLSPWVAGARIALGSPKGTSAASLLVEAFGDAVIPQIPEAIGRAILRVEAAYAAISAPRELAA